MAQRGRGRGGREQPVSTAGASTTATTEPVLDIYSLKFDSDSAGKLEELYHQIKKKRMEAEEASVGERRELKDAVDIVGTCTGMCPDFEVLERFVQRSIDPLERGVDGLLDVRRMVKRYDRGGAGAGQVPLEDIRPPPVLRGTVEYLMDDLLPRIGMEKTHAYIRDRTRAIRKDFTRQRDFSLDAMYCHERIARFHILGLHAHCRSDPDQEQQETEQLKKVLQTLTEMYQDSRGRHRSPNEAEFRAYYMLVHQRDKTALLTIRRVPQDIYCAPILQWALKLRFSQSRNVDTDKRQSHLNSDVTQMNYALLFRLWEDHGTSYLMACILEGHLNDIRRSILRLLKRSIDPGSRKVPSETLIELLRLDTEAELVHWVNALGWSIDAEDVVVPQDQTDIPSEYYPNQRLCVVKRPPSLTYSQLTLGITYDVDIGSSMPRQRRPRDEYGTPASIDREKPLPSPVLPFTAAPNSFAPISTPGETSVSIASAPDTTAPVFKWAPDVLQTLPSSKLVGSSTPSAETWKGFGAAAAALAARKAASGVEAASSAAESVWSFPTNATAAPAFRAASSPALIPVPALGSIPASSNAPDVLVPPSTVKPPPFTWPSAPVLPQQTNTDPVPSAASVPAPTPSLTSPTKFAQSAPSIALTPTMTRVAPPVPVVDPTLMQPLPVLAPPSSMVSAVSVPVGPASTSTAQPELVQTGTGSSVAHLAPSASFNLAPVPVPGITSSVPVSDSVLTPAPVLGLVAIPIAPLPTLVPAPPIAPLVHPSPPAPTPTPLPPQAPLYIRSEIIADQQYAMNLRYRSLRSWVLAYNSKLEREQAEELRSQREEQQRLAAEDIAFNMSLGRYDGEGDTAGLRHSLLGRKRKRWSHVDEDMSNPLAPHLMEEEKRRRIWQPGTFMRTIAQIARKRIRGHDIPQDWQVWISFAPDGGSATQWFRAKLVDTHQTSDLVKVKLGKRVDMTEQEEEPQPGLLILQCVSGMWRGSLDRAKELIEMVPDDNPFLPAFLIIMASDEGVPEWWVGELDSILQGLVVDRRAFILQSGSALATAESDFASEVDALTLDLEGIAPRLPLREVTNAFTNWWLVEFDYGAEQARSPTFDFPTLVWVVSVLMQALDKILEAVVGNCQETESPIPFNDFPSLGDVDSVYRTILEYYTEIGGEEPHSPYTIVEENPEALLALTHDTGLMVQFRLWQQEGRLRPRPGLRESELEKMAAAFDVELVQNLSGIDRSHLVFRNPPKTVLPPFQAEPTSRHATPPLLKRKHSALESDTSDLDMILNTRPAPPATTNGHVSGGRNENGDAIKRSRLTLEDLKKPFSPANISFRVQMAKARFDLEILKASEITEDTTEKQLWTSKANALVRIAKAVFDNVLSSSSPDDQAIIDCRAIVEIMRTIQDDIFDILRQRHSVKKNIQQLARIQVLPGSVELRGLVEAATDLHDRLNS